MAKEKIENDQALKHLFGKELLRRLAKSLASVHPSLDQKRFLGLMKELEKLEMKPRVHLLRDELHRQLPAEFPKALEILLESATDGSLEGFDLWPYTEFIQTHGLEHRELSLNALKTMTRLFTSEFAVRPFLKKDSRQTLKFLLACAVDSDVHLRRWASEGSRPRLPWGERLHEFVRDPSLTLSILEKLKFDEELYVRKSVANHLNDMAKDHPEFVIKVLTNWQKAAGAEHADKIAWITRHSLRTLIKEGNPGALKLLGVDIKIQIKFANFRLKPQKVQMGERLEFEFEIQSQSTKSQKLVVDYIIHFVKANKTRAPKVFKLKTFQLPARGSLRIQKSHHFKKITTRDYYPGLHGLEIQINGKVVAKRDWTLVS